MRSGLLGLLLLAGLCGSGSSQAASDNYRALLVGVSEYPSLDASMQLRGPRNDVVRVRDLLVQQGFAARNVSELSERAEALGLPTRANIIAQLEALARSAKRGDYIFIYMAGHGSQQPVPPGSRFAADEPDGLFEIFLPRDIGSWASLPGGKGGAVRNAIVDHEIREWVDRMTANGAFVWAIFDACHSASLVRSVGGADGDVRLRQVTPSVLAIPDAEMERASGPGRSSSSSRTRWTVGAAPASTSAGQAVYFYAAQSDWPTVELLLPLRQPDAKHHGLFTYHLMAALDGGTAFTYRQLAQWVLTQYGAIGEARATPEFSGTALDQPVLGRTGDSPKQWRFAAEQRLVLAAGALAGIQEGAVFAVLPSATATTDHAIGYAQAAHVETMTTALRPVPFRDHSAKSIESLSKGAVARLIQPGSAFKLSVGVDLAQCDAPCALAAVVDQLRREAPQTAGSDAITIEWTEQKQVADVQLVAALGRLWLLPPSMIGLQLCPIRAGRPDVACLEKASRSFANMLHTTDVSRDGLVQQLHGALQAAGRSVNLMRIVNALGTRPRGRQLQTTIEIVAKDGRRLPYAAGQVPSLVDGDRIDVTLRNTGSEPLDITALYVDSQHNIGILYPRQPGALNRLEAGAIQPLGLDVNNKTLGLERLLLIAVPVRKHTERADFSFLAQLPAGQTRGPGGAAAENDAMTLFRDAGFAVNSRRGTATGGSTRHTDMQVYAWQVVR